jgi:hypothetical protein
MITPHPCCSSPLGFGFIDLSKDLDQKLHHLSLVLLVEDCKFALLQSQFFIFLGLLLLFSLLLQLVIV